MKASWHTNFKRSPKEARTHADGTVFDSKAELARYCTLKLWVLAGEITNLKTQVKYKLILPVVDRAVRTPSGRVSVYTSDFEYDVCATGEHVIEDVKGFEDRVAKLRIAIFEAIYDVKVSIVK